MLRHVLYVKDLEILLQLKKNLLGFPKKLKKFVIFAQAQERLFLILANAKHVMGKEFVKIVKF